MQPIGQGAVRDLRLGGDETTTLRGSHSVNLMAQDSLAGSKDVDAPRKTVEVPMADFFPGFDMDLYGWWSRPHLIACARGFNFHDMGTVAHGRHVLAKASRAQSKPIAGELFRTEMGVAL